MDDAVVVARLIRLCRMAEADDKLSAFIGQNVLGERKLRFNGCDDLGVRQFETCLSKLVAKPDAQCLPIAFLEGPDAPAEQVSLARGCL